MQRLRTFIAPAVALVSAALLDLAFPLNGPLPSWRAAFAWFALAPLLAAILRPGGTVRRGFGLAYLAGVAWFGANCSWIYQTMHLHGGLPEAVSLLILAGFALMMGLYTGLFGLGLGYVYQRSGSARLALAAAPFLWVADELLLAHVHSFPWDQLGASQVDNVLLMRLLPWTGVYGVSFALMVSNALLGGCAVRLDCSLKASWTSNRRTWAVVGMSWMTLGCMGLTLTPPAPVADETALLVQPNLDVDGTGYWTGPGEWQRHIDGFGQLASTECRPYLVGLPVAGAPKGEVVCPPWPVHPALVAWPESPAPFFDTEARFASAMPQVARQAGAPLFVGGLGVETGPAQTVKNFNSALVFDANGKPLGRYDKIHLVPFGEYIPFQNLLFFAHSLTASVGQMTPGTERKVFAVNGHRVGVFICYESVFADEVRQFVAGGAEVLVNLSDDGWYGDTSAPWQHLNMARLRAIENRRWILRDTNNGVTAAIDPFGSVRQSVARHRVDALPAGFSYGTEQTFYTRHGDLFALLCATLTVAAIGLLRFQQRV